MILPITLAVIATIFYSITNHIDKFLISKMVKNADYKALILVSSIVAGGVMSIIYLFVCNFQLNFDLNSIIILLINSAIYTVANILWFKALDREDTTIVVIMFQLIPVFMLLLSPLFLSGQNINSLQLIGGGIVSIAAFFVTYEPEKKKFNKSKLFTLLLMTFVSIAYSIWFILQRYINLSHDFNKTTLWSNITLFLVGIIIFVFIKSFRQSFQKMLKTNGKKIIGLNLINELLNSFGGVISAFAGTMTSLALISFTQQGVQPFAVLIIGVLITKFLPSVEKEDISSSTVKKRVIMIVLCIIGLAFIQFG